MREDSKECDKESEYSKGFEEMTVRKKGEKNLTVMLPVPVAGRLSLVAGSFCPLWLVGGAWWQVIGCVWWVREYRRN